MLDDVVVVALYDRQAVTYFTPPQDLVCKVFAARRSDDWLSWDETLGLARQLGLRMVPWRSEW